MLKIRPVKKIWNNRELYMVHGRPLYGYIGFGVIDRGTNVLQVRPTTICPLSCIFCSVDAGPYSRNRWAEFIVDHLSIYDSVVEIARFKGGGIEALLDTIGEPFTYPWLVELVEKLKESSYISSVAIETHGSIISYNLIEKLEKAGLDRINLSIDTLNPQKAKMLQGVQWYDVNKVKKFAEYVVKNTRIDLHVTPVWIPGVNDDDVYEVVRWAYSIGAGKRWPPVTIQKYNEHKHGRKLKNIKPLTWRQFWNRIRDFEKKTGLKVTWDMRDWHMEKRPRYPCPFKKGDIVGIHIISKGVFKNEYIGVSMVKPWLVTVFSRHNIVSRNVLSRITRDKDCIYIGEILSDMLPDNKL